MALTAACAAWGISLACAASAAPPAPPRSVEALAVSPTEVRVCWLPSPGASGYRVERDGRELAVASADAREFDDQTASAGQTYRYTVSALNGGETSEARGYTERAMLPLPQSAAAARRPAIDAEYDVVVAQASSSGVAAAIEAARHGLRVALIEPTTRVGGMPANGLSATDIRRPEHASGFFVRFRDRVVALYAAEGVKQSGIKYEPRIAQQAMKELLYSTPGITLYRNVRPTGVVTEATSPGRKRIRAIAVEEMGRDGAPDGRRALLGARTIIDATDCGDLAAWAGAPFRVGREPRSAREPHNGVIYYDRANDKALPGSTGEGDRRIQSYAYLVTVKRYPGEDRTIARPPGYREEDFTHAKPWATSWNATSGTMPGSKYELNEHPHGADLQGANYAYPNAGYAERKRIETLHRDRALGYLYYIQTVQGQKDLGLPDDEYRDTGGFPPLLYVREARRIVGEQLPDETDIVRGSDTVRPESIGIGDYPMDSHAVRPKTDWSTPDLGEGEWWLVKQTPVNQLPIGILIPRGLDNLWVTTAVSSTHVSYGTFRMEPERMAFGQAAGIGAALALAYGRAPRELPVRQIQQALLPHAANLTGGDQSVILRYFPDVAPSDPDYREIEYLATRGFAPDGDKFQPDAPTTRAEMRSWLLRLAGRAAVPPPGQTVTAAQRRDPVRRGAYPQAGGSVYMGLPADPVAVADLTALAPSAEPARRDEIAHWLAALLPEMRRNTPIPLAYSDLADDRTRRDAAVLASAFIESRIWDGASALGPEGLRFRPDQPLSHRAMFLTLYIAQIGLGPLFDDHPAERFTDPSSY